MILDESAWLRLHYGLNLVILPLFSQISFQNVSIYWELKEKKNCENFDAILRGQSCSDQSQ